MKRELLHQKMMEWLAPRLQPFGIAPSEITLNANLVQTGMMDSFSLVELIYFVEDCTGKQVAFESLAPEHFSSLEGILALYGE